jgi:hypothetical protein
MLSWKHQCGFHVVMRFPCCHGNIRLATILSVLLPWRHGYISYVSMTTWRHQYVSMQYCFQVVMETPVMSQRYPRLLTNQFKVNLVPKLEQITSRDCVFPNLLITYSSIKLRWSKFFFSLESPFHACNKFKKSTKIQPRPIGNLPRWTPQSLLVLQIQGQITAYGQDWLQQVEIVNMFHNHIHPYLHEHMLAIRNTIHFQPFQDTRQWGNIFFQKRPELFSAEVFVIMSFQYR